jgi:hypothetical protein
MSSLRGRLRRGVYKGLPKGSVLGLVERFDCAHQRDNQLSGPRLDIEWHARQKEALAGTRMFSSNEGNVEDFDRRANRVCCWWDRSSQSKPLKIHRIYEEPWELG